MKKVLYAASIALFMAWATPDATAQNRTIGNSSDSNRPLPTNSERTRAKDAPLTNGRPNEQIRINETDSERNRNRPEADINEEKENNSRSEEMQENRPEGVNNSRSEEMRENRQEGANNSRSEEMKARTPAPDTKKAKKRKNNR